MRRVASRSIVGFTRCIVRLREDDQRDWEREIGFRLGFVRSVGGDEMGVFDSS